MKILLTAILWCWMGLAIAQQSLEIIELKSQRVDQVLPVLQPLLEPGATLSGMNNQLFLRASARNREEIKKALAAIDKPARQLVIRVTQNRDSESARQGAAASGQVVLGTQSRAEVDARVWDSRSVRRDSGGQMVRALEGSPAFIQIGRSLPVPMQQVVVGPNGVIVSETTVYQDVGQGFYAVPRLSGGRVTVEISQHADTTGRRAQGVIQTQRLSTTVSGRLGEWIELGGSGQQSAGAQRGTLSLSTRDVREERAIWLMVEEVN